MSELLVTLLRFSYLILLWALVLLAIGVLRRDVFGTRVLRRGGAKRPSNVRPPRESRPAVVGKPGPPLRTSASRGVGEAAGALVGGGDRPAVLLVTDGALRGRSLPLGTSAATLGRAPNSTLVLEDDFASSRHARIYPHDGRWWVEDLGSTNGTFVDGERISRPTELTPGRQVRIGQTVIELQR